MPLKSEECIYLMNSNLLFYRGLAKINQHMPYHFSMLLHPDNYASEWKHLLWQMLDFIAFKETMAPKHFELVNQLAQTNEQHIEVSNQIEIQKQKKEELEITRQTSIAIVEDLSKETMKIK